MCCGSNCVRAIALVVNLAAAALPGFAAEPALTEHDLAVAYCAGVVNSMRSNAPADLRADVKAALDKRWTLAFAYLGQHGLTAEPTSSTPIIIKRMHEGEADTNEISADFHRCEAACFRTSAGDQLAPCTQACIRRPPTEAGRRVLTCNDLERWLH